MKLIEFYGKYLNLTQIVGVSQVSEHTLKGYWYFEIYTSSSADITSKLFKERVHAENALKEFSETLQSAFSRLIIDLSN